MRSGTRNRPSRPTIVFKKKKCKFCVEKIRNIDYKDVDRLKKHLTEKGKIVSRRITGNCAHHQRKLAIAIRRARDIALLSFVSE